MRGLYSRSSALWAFAAFCVVGFVVAIGGAEARGGTTVAVAYLCVIAGVATLGMSAYLWQEAAREQRWRRSRLLRRRGDVVSYEASDKLWANAFFGDVRADEWSEYQLTYRAEHLLRDESAALPTVAFDLRVEEQTAGRVHGVVGTPMGAITPAVLVQPGDDDVLRFGGRVVEFESYDFGRRFTVRTVDPRAASAVLTPRVMEQLVHLSGQPGGRRRAWMFSGGYVLSVALDRRNTPSAFVHADQWLRPLVNALPSVLGSLYEPRTAARLDRPAAAHGFYTPRRISPLKRWRIPIVYLAVVLVAPLGGIVHRHVNGTDSWAWRDDKNRTVEKGRPWGAACRTIVLDTSALPADAASAVTGVAADTTAGGVPVVADRRGLTRKGDAVVQVRIGEGPGRYPHASAWDLSFRTARGAGAGSAVLSSMEVTWRPEGSGLSGPPLYRRLARITVVNALGVVPTDRPARGSAIRADPAGAPDRWAAKDLAFLREQAGCASA